MNFAAKEAELVRYLAAIRRMEKHFAGFMLRHIPRAKNAEADKLAKAATHNAQLPPDVFFQVLTDKSIKEEEDHPVAVHAIAVRIGGPHFLLSSLEVMIQQASKE